MKNKQHREYRNNEELLEEEVQTVADHIEETEEEVIVEHKREVPKKEFVKKPEVLRKEVKVVVGINSNLNGHCGF